MKKSKKVANIFIPNTKIYLFIIGILAFVIGYYNLYLGLVNAIILIILVYYNFKESNKKSKKLQKYMESFSREIDTISKQGLLSIPIPFIISELDGKINWYNNKFADIVNKKNLFNKNIENILPDFSLKDIIDFSVDDSNLDEQIQRDKESKSLVKVKDIHYKIIYNLVKVPDDIGGSKYILMIYFIDVEKYEKLKQQYKDERINIALVAVDNYDEVMQDLDEEKRPLLIAEMDKRIKSWSNDINGFARKYSDDKFFIVFENKHLKKLEEKKFEILDDIRSIEVGNKFPLTLSVGIGVLGKDPVDIADSAQSAKDLALGRGGDQVVVKKKDDIAFYGGTTSAVEKTTKVKSRVIAYAFRQLINESDKVFIMGHKNPDMDAIGAAMGIFRSVLKLGKEPFIILNEPNYSIEKLYSKILEEDDYKDRIIHESEALLNIGANSLLVVVDTHRNIFVESPKALELTDKIVVIDHHRKVTDFIEPTVLSYHETYVSSTSELVTEMLFYMDNKMNILPVEANALLGGIVLDTKNFNFKTGVRTFEAASLLKRAGANTVDVKEFFKDDLETVIERNEVLKRADIYKDKYALAISTNTKNAQLVAAQSADELLNIKGVLASFVLGESKKNQIFISGRSMGKVNVQVILEKLGGGGHLTVAGAQLKDINIYDAKEKLEKAIDEYIKSEEDDEDEGDFE